MKRLIILLLLLLFSTNIEAQSGRGTLRGFIADSTSGEALPFGNVLIKELNSGTSTDQRGYFIITSIPANKKYNIVFSYVGYKSKELSIFIGANKVTDIKIILEPVSIELSTIEKVASKIPKEKSTDLSLQKIVVKDLETLPKGVEVDIFRSLQYLPGVRSGGDVSAKYYVRGGASNQNLVLLDNSTVYHPFHAFGIFSAIDPEIINSIEFYKGGFTSELSSRLSSVMKINTKDGNRNQFGGKASASLLSTKALVEGPIPNGSFLLSGRRSHSTGILKKFMNNKNAPIDFYDVALKLNYSDDEFMKDAKFTVHGFASGDYLKNNSPVKEDFAWSNKIIGMNYFQISDSPLFYQIDFSLSHFDGELNPHGSNSKARKNSLSDISVKMDFNYVYGSKDELDGGFKITEIKTNLFLENARRAVTDIATKGTNISAYLKYKLLRFDKFGADVGTRINLTRLGGGGSDEQFMEPRVSMTYRILPQLAIKAAWGIYQQDLVTLSDENEIINLFEPWIITPLYLKPSNAIHYVAGIETFFTPELELSIEGYYKRILNLALINERKFFSTDNDLVAGTGKSYGIEVLTRYSYSRASLTASYSLSNTTNEVYGVSYSPRYDAKHSLNLILEVDLGYGFTASTTWIYNSGQPFTQISGYYEKLTIDDVFAQNYLFDSYLPFRILADKNMGRLPDYHRLDFNLSKKFQLGDFKFYLDFSIINVYDRKNIFYFDRNTGERVDMLRFLPTATIKVEL